MASGDIEAIKKDLVDINDFVKERFDPVTKQVDLLKDETERIKREIADTQQRERTTRRNALTRYVEDQSGVVVPEGPYSGMDVLDLALVRSFAYSQRREAFGPAWIERAEEAKRLLTSSVTPGTVAGRAPEPVRRSVCKPREARRRSCGGKATTRTKVPVHVTPRPVMPCRRPFPSAGNPMFRRRESRGVTARSSPDRRRPGRHPEACHACAAECGDFRGALELNAKVDAR